MNSSPYFRNLLSPNIKLFLFENTFKILAPTLWKEGHDEELPLSTVFTCRGVCSHWNKVVDKLLQEKFSDSELPSYLNTLLNWKTATKFCTSQDHKVFQSLKHFESTHHKPLELTRNPFIWTNLKVRTINDPYELPDSDKRYLNAISSLLQKYGYHIHHFKLSISGRSLHIEDCLKLRDWLTQMPNLKSLTIIDKTSSFERDLSLNDFQVELTSNPNYQTYPKLQHLETVHFQNLKSPIFNQFISQNCSHVNSLNLSKCDDHYTFFYLPFPKLSKLISNIDSVKLFKNYIIHPMFPGQCFTTYQLYSQIKLNLYHCQKLWK